MPRVDVWDVLPADAVAPIDCNFPRGFDERYTVGRDLGKGGFGTVRLVYNKLTGEEFACKSIQKRLTIPNISASKQNQHLENIKKEITVLKKLRGSLNVVHLEDVFEDDIYVHIVMEYCRGGELLHSIGKRPYSEHTVSHYIKAVLRTLSQCHAHHILHRDVKPGNFMLVSEDASSPLKAIDFGLSVFFDPKKLPRTDLGLEGTPWFMAPEALSGTVWPASDVWAAGVMAYQLLSGYCPFDDRKNTSAPALSLIWKSILMEEPSFSSPHWQSISAEAKDFCQTLLNKNPAQRPSAREALEHPWLKTTEHARSNQKKVLLSTVVQRLQSYTAKNLFKRTILDMIANELLQRHMPEATQALSALQQQQQQPAEHEQQEPQDASISTKAWVDQAVKTRPFALSSIPEWQPGKKNTFVASLPPGSPTSHRQRVSGHSTQSPSKADLLSIVSARQLAACELAASRRRSQTVYAAKEALEQLRKGGHNLQRIKSGLELGMPSQTSLAPAQSSQSFTGLSGQGLADQDGRGTRFPNVQSRVSSLVQEGLEQTLGHYVRQIDRSLRSGNLAQQMLRCPETGSGEAVHRSHHGFQSQTRTNVPIAASATQPHPIHASRASAADLHKLAAPSSYTHKGSYSSLLRHGSYRELGSLLDAVSQHRSEQRKVSRLMLDTSHHNRDPQEHALGWMADVHDDAASGTSSTTSLQDMSDSVESMSSEEGDKGEGRQEQAGAQKLAPVDQVQTEKSVAREDLPEAKGSLRTSLELMEVDHSGQATHEVAGSGTDGTVQPEEGGRGLGAYARFMRMGHELLTGKRRQRDGEEDMAEECEMEQCDVAANSEERAGVRTVQCVTAHDRSPAGSMDTGSMQANSLTESAGEGGVRTTQQAASTSHSLPDGVHHEALASVAAEQKPALEISPVQEVSELLQAMHLDEKEALSVEELAKNLESLGYQLAPHELAALLQEVVAAPQADAGMLSEPEAHEVLTRSQFLASQMDWHEMQVNHRDEWLALVQAAFADLDRDRDGCIKAEDIVGLLKDKLPAEEVNMAVEDALMDACVEGGTIDFDDFVELVRSRSHDSLSSLELYESRWLSPAASPHGSVDGRGQSCGRTALSLALASTEDEGNTVMHALTSQRAFGQCR